MMYVKSFWVAPLLFLVHFSAFSQFCFDDVKEGSWVIRERDNKCFEVKKKDVFNNMGFYTYDVNLEAKDGKKANVYSQGDSMLQGYKKDRSGLCK